MLIITREEARLIADAMYEVYKKIKGQEPSEYMLGELFYNYCKDYHIDVSYENDDIPDDVDETNYNPFIGEDEYD